jgi:hypothetical protein
MSHSEREYRPDSARIFAIAGQLAALRLYMKDL